MENIKGLEIKQLGFVPVKLGDLLYYEGPLLSHFIDKNNQNDHYFYRWVDFDENAHRWLVFKLSKGDLRGFFSKSLNLYEMIAKNATVTLIDLDNDLGKKQILVTTIEELPKTYLPSENSYFESEFYQDYARKLKANIEKEENEYNLLIEVLNRVQVIDNQQKQTFGLLSDLLHVITEKGLKAPPY